MSPNIAFCLNLLMAWHLLSNNLFNTAFVSCRRLETLISSSTSTSNGLGIVTTAHYCIKEVMFKMITQNYVSKIFSREH